MNDDIYEQIRKIQERIASGELDRDIQNTRAAAEDFHNNRVEQVLKAREVMENNSLRASQMIEELGTKAAIIAEQFMTTSEVFAKNIQPYLNSLSFLGEKTISVVESLNNLGASFFQNETVAEVFKQINSASQIASRYVNTNLDFLTSSKGSDDEDFEDSLLTKEFKDITDKFEEILDSPEVPEELHVNITALKESINSMSDSEIKDELTRMSNQFKVIETSTEASSESDNTIVFPPEFMNVIQNLNENMINLANKIEKLPNIIESNKQKKKLRQFFVALIIAIIYGIFTGYSEKFGSDLYKISLQKKMNQQLSSQPETNQSLQYEKNKSDLVANNLSNHNE